MQSAITIQYPVWLLDFIKSAPAIRGPEDAMRLAIELARMNIERDHGGPFGALVVQKPSNKIIGAGVNCVARNNNAILHAEIMALMMAQKEVGSFSLKSDPAFSHELITTCEPCAMCLGGALWSGVSAIICGAHRSDAQSIGFDEGPVFDKSYRYLKLKGIKIVFGLLKKEARDLFALYREKNGLIYNG
jgi:tRNA(Arg) A34 adenosine deaminase TadA